MKRTLKIFVLLTIFIGILFITSNVMAVATASITVDKSNMTVGDTVTATVKYTAAAWDLKVTADSGLTTSDTVQYANTTDSAENESKSFTVKFKASKAGELYIYLKGDVTDEASTVADTVSKKVKVTVKEKTTTTDKDTSSSGGNTTTTDKDTSSADKGTSNTNKDTTTTEKPKEKSNNAYLSTLGVTPKEYDFSGFSKTKTSYSVTVPRNVDSLKVLYKTADSNAKVSVSGNSGFEVGSDNKITIKVTAEDGKTTKTYTIKVTQLAEEEEKPGNLIEEETKLYLTSLSLEGIKLTPEFAKDTYSYTATLDDSSVDEIKVTTEANMKKAKIDISGNTNLVEGENTINIILTLDDSEVQAVYQIVVNKIVATMPITDVESDTPPSSSDIDLIGSIKNYIGIVMGVIILIIVAVIVLVILLRRENKKIEDDDEYEELEAEEYNVYKNDENEFVNNEIPKDNFIESLYRQRNGNTYNEEDLTEGEKETLEEISKQTEEIFTEKVEGQSVEYISDESYDENPLKVRKRRKGKGKHSL